jgi:predicted DNA-binding transcriptional regulator AlpA
VKACLLGGVSHAVCAPEGRNSGAPPRRVLRRPDAARYLGLSVRTLERFATEGSGPRFVRLSASATGYTLEDLDAWLKSRTFASTSEEDAARGGRAA